MYFFAVQITKHSTQYWGTLAGFFRRIRLFISENYQYEKCFPNNKISNFANACDIWARDFLRCSVYRHRELQFRDSEVVH